MKKLLSYKTAGIILIICLVFLMLFHLLVAVGILPDDIVWGGNLDRDTVVTYELAALVITGILLLFALTKAGYIKNKTFGKIANVFIWIMVVYFAFMIFGNAMAKTLTEKVIFIPLSILMLVSSLRLAIEKKL
jgi:hypothetical protein